MGNESANRTQYHSGQHLSAAFSLVEVIFALCVLGIVGVVVSMVMAQMMQLFTQGSDEAESISRLQVPLSQMMRELSATDPDSVEWGTRDGSHFLRFPLVALSGRVAHVEGNRLMTHPPHLPDIAVGKKIRFSFPSNRLYTITSVRGDEVTLDAPVELFTPSFLVVEGEREYYLEDDRLMSQWTRYTPGGSRTQTGVLCEDIARFTVEPFGSRLFRVVLGLQGSDGEIIALEERSWAFQ